MWAGLRSKVQGDVALRRLVAGKTIRTEGLGASLFFPRGGTPESEDGRGFRLSPASHQAVSLVAGECDILLQQALHGIRYGYVVFQSGLPMGGLVMSHSVRPPFVESPRCIAAAT